MRTRLFKSSFLLLAIRARAILRSDAEGVKPLSKEVYTQTMMNIGDVQYTVDVSVGGQVLRAIPDSGSFDLLVFSHRCFDCTSALAPLYNDSVSPSYENGDFKADQTFGSGCTHSVEAYDRVKLGHAEVDRQVFWQVVGADSGFRDSSFSAILGTGPPSSAAKIADKEAEDIQQEVADMHTRGQDNSNYASIVAHYQDVAAHAHRQVPIMEELGMRTFSVCLSPASGANGTWVWNDDVAAHKADLFMRVPVVGDMYWSAELRHVSLDFGAAVGGETLLGCSPQANGRCNAVLDTGTSLLVVPYEAYSRVHGALETWGEHQNGTVNCKNLDLLPDMKFRLGNMEFTLPPESYMGEVNGELSEELRDLMPHASERVKQGKEGCMPMLMTMDESSDFGEVWILGLPFFRKYYTTFELAAGSRVPESMYFARADESCRPISGELLRQQERRTSHPLRFQADRIRVPTWISRRARKQHLQRVAANPGRA